MVSKIKPWESLVLVFNVDLEWPEYVNFKSLCNRNPYDLVYLKPAVPKKQSQSILNVNSLVKNTSRKLWEFETVDIVDK